MRAASEQDRIATPWLRIRSDQTGQYCLEGSSSVVFGHQIDRGDGRPGGVYAQWNWDGQQLTVRNDRAGLGQLLYATLDDGNGIALSPHVEQLLELGADSTIDDGATSVLVRLGFLLDVDTPFRQIRALPPNATLTWSRGKLEVHGDLFIPQPASMAREAAVETYVELFRQSISRRPTMPGMTVVPLTGGQDSRHIVFELCRRGTPPDRCITVRPYRRVTCDDASIARSLADRLGIEHQQVNLSRSLVAEDFRKYRRIGPLSDEGGWTSAMWDHLRHDACAYDGIAGDMLSSGYLAGLRYDAELHAIVASADWASLAKMILDHFAAPEPAFARLIRVASYQDQGRDYVLQRIIEQLKRVAAAPHPLAMFMIYNRTRREIAMMSWLLCSQLTPYYAPYTDEDLFAFLASLPAQEFAVGQWFHRAAIARGYPEWSDIAYLDSKAVRGMPVTPMQAAKSIADVSFWTLRNLPALWPVVARWGVQRAATRASLQVAPRRVVQHFLALEQLFRRRTSWESA